jgi:hypothetical protein
VLSAVSLGGTFAGAARSSCRTISADAGPSTELQAYVGKYHSPEIDATFTLLVKDGRLHLDAPRRPRQELRASIQNEFADQEGVLGGFVLQFERDASNRVIGFRYNAPRVLKLRFDRQDDR